MKARIFPGIWIVAAVMIFFTAHLVWRQAKNPRNIELMAKAFSSINIIQKPAVMNHDGSLIGLIHTTERGVGVFLENVKKKTEQKICEVKDLDYSPSSAAVFGWSPDDNTFAFSWNNSLHFLKNDGTESIRDTDPSDSIPL